MLNRIATNFQRFLEQSFFLFKLYALGLLLFAFVRLIFILSFGNLSELSENKLDLIHSFITGARFDTVVLTYAFLLLLFLCIVNLFLRNGINKEQLIIDRAFIYFSTFALSFIVLVCIVDFFYYKFFSSHINVIMFGIVDDDTKAILKSMWTDYPVIRIFLVMAAVVILLKKSITHIYNKKTTITLSSVITKSTYFILFLASYLLGMRCSFGNVPLEFMEASISSNTFINNIPLNGVFALKNALEEKDKGEIDISEASYLSNYGYKNNKEMLNDYANYFFKQNNGSNNLNVDSMLFARTPKDLSLEEKPFNIVFLQMESMSSYFFKLHSKNFNMLGALEDQLDKCIVFPNFISCRNFTIFSMDGLIVNSPLSALSQSKHLNVSFPSSSILPFVKSGYETEFVSGGRLNWRNLDQFLPRQGFSKLEGGADIKKHFPNATEEHEWGVYDEFLMRRIVQKLKEKRDKPVFIYGMTITNHTPYKPPPEYNEFPIVFGDDIKALVNNTDEKTRETFVCYQYMCNSLGWFVNEISTSELADNTIIIATGDHSSHVADNLFGFSDKDLMDWYGVPLIFYVPERLKSKLFIDTNRFGSHKDIFPTIYNLALSNANYYNGGNNLFSSDTTINYFGLYESTTAINKDGCSRFLNSNESIYYDWKDKKGGKIEVVKNPSSSLIELGKRAKAYSAFNKFKTIKEINDKKNLIDNIKH